MLCQQASNSPVFFFAKLEQEVFPHSLHSRSFCTLLTLLLILLALVLAFVLVLALFGALLLLAALFSALGALLPFFYFRQLSA